MITTIKVKHNVEMAHRLFSTPGKCANIHGHSWLVCLTLRGEVNSNGLLEGLDFGFVKSVFRTYLDENFDHRVLLNLQDPWAQDLDPNMEYANSLTPRTLPGLQTMDGDPTTENFAEKIGAWASVEFERPVAIEVWETRVNCATWSNLA